MPLDPAAKIIIELAAQAGFELGSGTAQEARAMVAASQVPVEPHPVAKVENRTVPSPSGAIPVRIYWPTDTPNLPVVMYFHGGGWVICDLDTHDQTSRRLAADSGAIVVSVDYRLAPEHKWPAAPEDCFAATSWVAANAASIGGDPTRLAVAGDSAGGNLAAVTALMARDKGGPALAYQLLIYPVTGTPWDGRASTKDNAEGYYLTTKAMEWFTDLYMANREDTEHPYFSPTRGKDLGGLPPALVITAEYDPLRDEGEDYGRMLQGAGVPTTITRYDGMIHGFYGMDAMIPKARDAQIEAAAALNAAFAQY